MSTPAIILCDLSSPPDCKDPHPHRWYCMRGHALEAAFARDGKAIPATPGVCPLMKCDRAGANRTPKETP